MSESCEWKEERDFPEDDFEYWNTDCGNAHQFINGDPKSNDHKFCPYCGKTLEVKDEGEDA